LRSNIIVRRFYSPQQLETGKSVVIGGTDAMHVSKVLRLKVGDMISVFDGRGHAFECRIKSISPHEVDVIVEKDLLSKTESDVHITFAQAMLKSKKMDTLIRQATELGISRWAPFFSERSVPTPDHKRMIARLERWNKISREALKQCGRDIFMEVLPPVSMEKMLTQGQACDRKIIFWECESAPLEEPIPLPPEQIKSLMVVVGPEGGFSAPEIEQATSLGYETLSLGPRILKAETAAVAAAVLMQFCFGDMGGSG
jgi:16S rRNA (uracil1498-N3)-methyltransferase